MIRSNNNMPSDTRKSAGVVVDCISTSRERSGEEVQVAEEKLSPNKKGERSSSWDDDGPVEEDGNEDQKDGPEDGEKFQKFRREKRLAMNRASARARRKKKKVILETLTERVTEMTKQNQNLQRTNDTLIRKVERLEAALTKAQQTIFSLQGPGGSLALAPPTTSNLYPHAPLGGVTTGTSSLAASGNAFGAANLRSSSAAGAAEAYHSLLLRGASGLPATTSASKGKSSNPGGNPLSNSATAGDPIYAAALRQLGLHTRQPSNFGEIPGLSNLGQYLQQQLSNSAYSTTATTEPRLSGESVSSMLTSKPRASSSQASFGFVSSRAAEAQLQLLNAAMASSMKRSKDTQQPRDSQ